MKIGIFGDVHGNVHALKAVLADGAKNHIDSWICLGDLFMKGPQPFEVAETMMELVKNEKATVLLGNTDQWLLNGLPDAFSKDKVLSLTPFIYFARRNLSITQMEWLSTLPNQAEMKVGKSKLFATHSCVNDIEKQVMPYCSDDSIIESITGKNRNDIKYLTYGHIHMPFFRKVKDIMVFNPGSVGMPFDSEFGGSYAILEEGMISFRRVKYSVGEIAKIATGREFPQVEKYVKAIRNGIQF